MQDLVEVVEQALELAKRGGAEGAEVYVIDAPEDAVTFEPSSSPSPGSSGAPALRTAITVPKKGLGLAARWGARVGFASTTDLSARGIEAVVGIARDSAAPEDPPLPLTVADEAGRPGLVAPQGLLDHRLAEMNLPDLVTVTREIAAETTEAGAAVLEAVGLACCRRIALGNSLGLSRWSFDTRIGAAVYAASPGGGLAGWARGSRSLDGIRALDVGRTAAGYAKAAENPRPVTPGPQTVILRPDAVLSLLAYSLGPALGADRVLAGTSPFGAGPAAGSVAGSLGQPIASDILTIVDDAARPGGTGSYAFDAEGVPARATTLIGQGRLVSFLHNNRTAALWSGATTSTANASRDRADRMSTFVEPSGLYGYRPGVAPSNLVVSAPDASYPTAAAAGVDHGLVVNDVMGAFVIDPAVGDFSVTTTNAWALERGELAYPVKRAMLSGNVYALLKRVQALVGEPGEVTGPFSLFSPSWVVADLTVV